MSTFGRSEKPSILIVADAAQPPFSDAVAAWSEAGAAIIVVSDVYSAIAQLALVPDIRHVLIDIRHLDPHERAFLQLAPRYFRDVQLCIADLPGASVRLRLEDNPAPMKSVAAFVAATLASPVHEDRRIHEDSWPVRPMEQPTAEAPPIDAPDAPPPRPPLSTDGGLPADDAAPSLHEAVRRRMAGDDPGMIQRKPPVRTPPRPAPTVSPQELDALLAPDNVMNPESHPGDANTGRPR